MKIKGKVLTHPIDNLGIPVQVGIIQSAKGLKRTKRQRKGELCPLFESGHASPIWAYQCYCFELRPGFTPFPWILGFPGGSVVKNPPANAGDSREVASIPGWGRSPGAGNGNMSSIPVWKIPWTEEPGGLQFMGSQRVRHD